MLSVLFVIYYLIKYKHHSQSNNSTSPPSRRNEDQESTCNNVSRSKSLPSGQDAAGKLFRKSFIDLRKTILFDKMSAATLPELLETHLPGGEGDGDDLPLPVNPIIRRRSSSKTHTRHYRIRLPPNPRRAKR
uniref:Uncharacterized protein n=1 Tax=Cacopsylla melanoneura TaxID=428564 RepID=A0A8D9AU39_9HEMI